MQLPHTVARHAVHLTVTVRTMVAQRVGVNMQSQPVGNSRVRCRFMVGFVIRVEVRLRLRMRIRASHAPMLPPAFFWSSFTQCWALSKDSGDVTSKTTAAALAPR